MLRRSFFKTCGLGAVGLTALGADVRRFKAAGAATRGSAENLIFIHLQGAASHVDTFDLKKGAWMPADFEPASFGDIELPTGLFPSLGGQSDKFSLLRCLNGVEQVHDRARYLLQTSQTFNPTFAKEHPNIGSVMAFELEASRAQTDILPTFLAINANVQGPGLLPSTFAPFTFQADSGIPGLVHPGGEALFEKRYASLLAVDGSREKTAPGGAIISDYGNFYRLGEQMMYEPAVQQATSVSDEDLARYGASGVGTACAVAVKSLAQNRGARVIQISQGGWDHHYDIYNANVQNNLYGLCNQLDSALSALLADLAALPGKRGGTLLDETLVVVTGEFGRTPGDLTGNDGRDHYAYAWSALVAGGGVAAGRVFGATDELGASIVDPFWSQSRFITMPDLIATMYSSLGIDWTTEIQSTPSGRVYEYTPKVNGQAGYYKDIVEMFT